MTYNIIDKRSERASFSDVDATEFFLCEHVLYRKAPYELFNGRNAVRVDNLKPVHFVNYEKVIPVEVDIIIKGSTNE